MTGSAIFTATFHAPPKSGATLVLAAPIISLTVLLSEMWRLAFAKPVSHDLRVPQDRVFLRSLKCPLDKRDKRDMKFDRLLTPSRKGS